MVHSVKIAELNWVVDHPVDKIMTLCEWCGVKEVKLSKNITCSRSCGSALRWSKMSREGKLIQFKNNYEAAKKTLYAKRLKGEIEKACQELNIPFTSTIAKLYVRARNRGYHNGYYTSQRRHG